MPSRVQVQLGGALSTRRAEVGDLAALRRLLARAARATLRHQEVDDGEISITLLDDGGIAELNRQFLAHDGPTDVLSFALYEAGEEPVGDIYIGWEQARRQAAAATVPETEELVRLAVHGVLHVLGHDHPDGEDRTASEMWRLQEQIVARVVES